MTDSSLNYEATRLEVLHQYQILDTPPEAVFDELTQLAAQICQTPVALIAFVDADRQWFKSKVGTQVTEALLDSGFCPLVVQTGESLIVPDTLADAKFATNPVVVSQPHVRFYAGMPLVTSEGYLLGTLCVLDFVPRGLSPEQVNALQTLSCQVMTQIELQFVARQVVQRDNVLLQVTQGVSASIGEAFFYSLVQHLSKALGVDYVYVSLVDNNTQIAKTIALYALGQMAENVEYSLHSTPCGYVVEQKKICCYPRGVQAQFPQDYLLSEMEVESYVAIPLFNSTGDPLGVFGVMDRKPLANVHLTESLLKIFATRAATELERQQAEAERAQLLVREQEARKQAEEANRLKDEFLAVLSHELRSPLNPILGWAKLLRTRKFDEVATDRALETIERNAKLQTQLIEDLLDVSRILQGKLSLNMSCVNLAFTMEAAIETVRLAAEAKSIEIRTLLEPNIEQVLGDSGRLQQVVWNLVSNAVKFTPRGGRVEVRLERVGTYAQIRVSDTGRGIEPEFLPYVFDYFRQADSTTTRNFGGLGLGLAIVRNLVELHGGIVQAASPGEGLGATFVVQLPLLEGSREAMVYKSIGEKNFAPLPLEAVRVLVVDDEADAREYLAFLLEQYGAKVTVVASALEALEALSQSQPDLLLSDIGMPEIDGYMLMRQIRDLKPQGGLIRAIALSAYAGEVDRQKAQAAGFQLHLSKPVEPEELVRAIFTLIKA